MKFSSVVSFRTVSALAVLTLLTTSLAFSQQNQTRPRKLAPGWVQLFNGKDFTNWRKVGAEKWIVDGNGAIYGEGISDQYGYLATEKTYRDFHLSLRYKCEAEGNSGVYIHTKFEGDTPKIIAGRQVEIDQTTGNNSPTGGVYGDGRGWVAWPAPEFSAVQRPYDWNDMLIQVEGNRYIVHLNGVEILDFTYPNPISEEGVIALQLHSGGKGRMRFRDIYIRDLTNR